jgi:hypothetical protein
VLDGVEWSTPRLGRFNPGKDPVPIVQEAGWAPRPVWTGRKISPPPGNDRRTVRPVASRYTDFAMPAYPIQMVPGHSWGKSGRGVALTTHPHLASKVKYSPPPPPPPPPQVHRLDGEHSVYCCLTPGPISALWNFCRPREILPAQPGGHLLSFTCTAAPHCSASRAASGPHRCAPDSLAPSPIISNVTSSGHCTALTCAATVTRRHTQRGICISSPPTVIMAGSEDRNTDEGGCI